MTTRTTKTFEDRLLDELQREIALRAEDPPEPVIRRTITTRRALVALAACVAAAGVVVALPSSTGGSSAYAVERHEDGSVTLTMEEIALGWGEKAELTERLRAEGIFVSVDKPRSGYVCAQPRGEMPPSRTRTYDVEDGAWSEPLTYTLHPGDTLAFEEPERVKGDVSPAWSMYVVEGRIEPCREVPFEGLVDEK
ncbi:hypothetical protein [Streptomyces europaeiscabiei]|uniref:hypothetical protein n=1 Tax=Streptomyces europaeiscabiei TaxID=146819 RepID=UPI002E11B248|nr:hypothetical protein OHB30_19775 [Streptomyces europaeiscabiei]